MGGEVLLHYWHLGAACRRLPFWGIFYKHRKTPQNIIFEGNSKTINPVVAKSYEKPKITSSWFYQCHPYLLVGPVVLVILIITLPLPARLISSNMSSGIILSLQTHSCQWWRIISWMRISMAGPRSTPAATLSPPPRVTAPIPLLVGAHWRS